MPEITDPNEVRRQSRREEKRAAKRARKGRRHDLRLLEAKHLHEELMAARHDQQTHDRKLADCQHMLAVIEAVRPLLLALGGGIREMRQAALAARATAHGVEATIAEKSPAYAIERLKMHAAAGVLVGD